MNLTIELSERGVRDGVVLIAAYHFLLAVASFLSLTAIFVYSIFPVISGNSSNGIQFLYLPILGVVITLFLAIAYFVTGIGLIRIKNAARMAGIFLALFGIIGGIFAVLGGVIGSLNAIPNDWLTVGIIGLALICVYSILVFLDIITLVFLLNAQVRSVFYGEEWYAQALEVMEEG